ncbi:MAG: amidohydrolase family protein, partial [Clostridiales bacterium]
ALAITKDTAPPIGGVIGYEEDGQLSGYMEEEAYIQCIKKVPMADLQEMLEAYSKAQEKYLSYGIATVQEGMMVGQMLPLYKSLLESGLLLVDLVGYSDLSSMEDIRKAFPDSLKKYDRHFKIGGYKIFLDGSPQVKTAWMKMPYRGSDDYCGYGIMTDEAVLAAIEKATAEEMQILAHCNGDAAIQQYLNGIQKVADKNKKILSLKPVIIHCQLISPSELAEAEKLKMIASFFIAHILHWGDIHIENFGYQRAKAISPANSALKNKLIFTFHQDAPVIEPNMLETIQCAVIRKTKTGMILDKNECISVIDALKAVTINAAYQYSEEEMKGSIKEGKQADFVIISDNPLTVAKDKIADIAVLATIKNGEVVFTKQ